jgi:hypothetical protein
MLNRKFISLLFILFLGSLIILPQASTAQFITIARKIKSMNSGNNNVATVILDAGAARIYKAVIDTLSASPKTHITKRDNLKNHVEFTAGSNAVSLQVDSLDRGLSQITVLATQNESASTKATDAAVNAILSVSRKAGIKCTVKED